MSFDFGTSTGPLQISNGSKQDSNSQPVSNLVRSGSMKAPIDQENKATQGVDEDKDYKLYPFDQPLNLDSSPEYTKFLNLLYSDFEPLLSEAAYKTYSLDSEDDEMNIGLLDKIKENEKGKRLNLQKLVNSVIGNVNDLISAKVSKTEKLDDPSLFNYVEALNVLNLLNALYFANPDERITLLSIWINRADIQPDEELIQEAMHSDDKPYRNSLFWSTFMTKLIIRGMFTEALTAMNDSGYQELQESDPNLFNLIVDFQTLLQNYNLVRFSTDLKSFISWKQTMARLREQSTSLTYENPSIALQLTELITIMCGHSASIQEHSTSWYESFFAYYLYQLPSSDIIPEYLQISLEKQPLDSTVSWESICVDLLHGKFLSVISSLELLDKSISTYVAILIQASGLLKDYFTIISNASSELISTIDQMLEQLALTYMTSQELFPIGVGIMISLNNSRTREVIAESLPKFKIKSNDDLEWCLSICAKLKLPQTANAIYKAEGANLSSQGYLYESLFCFAEAGDYTNLVSLAWNCFENLLLDGKFEDEQLVAKIQSNDIQNPLLRQAISPFVILYQFLEQESDKRDFNKILRLLSFNYLPKHFKTVLILIFRPYLNKRLLTIKQLVQLIKTLNDFEKDLKTSEEVYSKSTMLYELAKKKVSNNGDIFDWRSQGSLPDSIKLLILEMRKGISFEISFNFAESDY
ncbi:hypothetical protein CANARDRAFT_28211 [[Candida] arabinofermentans NRRL YB-2248]|uniref:Nuclear pore complex protein Nup85 n=1 Tax=[Candida] arabinofermentans NRRL YB-2248 TaxID=983967 RepID=A0A1E4T117_9ASCO|nr:hypothetical protein CANARDRAFT_28211 [[Candida] arabinofermentans NRRL YB-2248]